MNAQEIKSFDVIKEKIEVLKAKRAKAEGALEAIVQEWESAYEAKDLEALEAILAEKQKEQEEITESLATLYRELTELTNWALI